MTTQTAAELYLAQHQMHTHGRPNAIHNSHGKLIEELPVIYGFNNGGSSFFLSAVLLAEDGESLGGHACSDEGYMPSDLGIIEGSRPDRHETFRTKYPDGYRMEFVSYDDVADHVGLQRAFQFNDARQPDAQVA